MKRKKILVIGSAWTEVRYKKTGRAKLSTAVRRYFAGNGLVTALRLAEQGIEVCLAAAVGDDENGDLLLEQLKEKGVDTSGVRQEEGWETPRMDLFLREDAEGEFFTERVLSTKRMIWADLKGLLSEDFACVILEDLQYCPETVCRDLADFLESIRKKKCYVISAVGEGFTDEKLDMLIRLFAPLSEVFLLHAGETKAGILEKTEAVRRMKAKPAQRMLKKERMLEAWQSAADSILDGGAGTVVIDTGETGRYGVFCCDKDGSVRHLEERQYRKKTSSCGTQGTFTAYFAAAMMHLRFLRGASLRAADAARRAALQKAFGPLKGMEPLESAMTLFFEPVSRSREERKLDEENVRGVSYPRNLLRAVGISRELPGLFREEDISEDQMEGLMTCIGELDEPTARYLDYRYRQQLERIYCKDCLGYSMKEQDQLMKKAMDHLRRPECIRRVVLGRRKNWAEELAKIGCLQQGDKEREADKLSESGLPEEMVFCLNDQGVVDTTAASAWIGAQDQRIRLVREGTAERIRLMQSLTQAGLLSTAQAAGLMEKFLIRSSG